MKKINLIRKQESWRPFKVSWEGLEEVGETRDRYERYHIVLDIIAELNWVTELHKNVFYSVEYSNKNLFISTSKLIPTKASI